MTLTSPGVYYVMMTSLRDNPLRIMLQFVRAQESGDPYGFHLGPQEYILPSSSGESPSASFDWTPEVLADLQAMRQPGRDVAIVQRLGEKLRLFIKDAGWSQHEQRIIQAAAESRPIYMTIRSSAAELYALPWELLALQTGQLIGELPGLLLRFEWPGSTRINVPPRPRTEGGRILLAWSAAGGAVPAAEHVQAIHTASAAGFIPFNTSTDVVPHASLARIIKTLEEGQKKGSPAAVLHLLCHGAASGSSFGLCLDGESGAVVVDAMQLRQLAPFAATVRLVVLSACNSGNVGALGNQLGSVAQALHRCGFAAVLTARFPLSVFGSIAMTERFYTELLAGPASLETAFKAARMHLLLNEANLPRDQRPLDWTSLQLYARSDDGDDTRPVVFRPYRGLLAFQPEHHRFFFGRDAEIQEILTSLQALIDQKKARFLIVAGASGSGKSSLLLAGAVPRLLAANQQLAFLRMRPGGDPEHALNEVLARCLPGGPGLLVVDQFEEVFTQTKAPAVRESFVRHLWSLATAAGSDLLIVITLRVDFIGRCGELVLNADGLRLDRVAYDEAHRVFVAQMPLEQLRAAVIEPVHKVGLELQEGLVDRMLHEVGGEPGALPLLEDALDVLWQHCDGHELTQAAYEELGGVIGTLRKRADAIVDKLPSADLVIAQRLLVSLVAVADETTLDTRLRVPLVELRRAFSGAEVAVFERVLKEFVAARLLVHDGDEQTSQVEVAHEALIRKWQRLRSWLDEDRAGLVIQRRVKLAAYQWHQQGGDESLLYRGTQLAQASEWRKTWEPRLTEQERSFLDASEVLSARQKKLKEELLQRERKRAVQTRITAVVLGVLFIGATAAGLQAYRKSVLAAQKSLEAQNNASIAQRNADFAQQKSDEARDNLLINVSKSFASDPTTAATVLREVVHRNSILWTQSASDLLQARIAPVVLRGGRLGPMAFHPDGKKFAAVSDQTVLIFNSDGSGAPLALMKAPHGAAIITFSPDGKKLATAAPLSRDHTLLLWNADGSGAPLVLSGHEEVILSIAFSPDGRKLITGSQDKTARVWNVDGSSEPLILRGHQYPVVSAVFSSEREKIITVSSDNIARIWSSASAKTPRLFRAKPHDTSSVAVSPDGRKILFCLSDKTAEIRNVDGSGTPVVFDDYDVESDSATFSPDGRKLAAIFKNQTVVIHNAEDPGAPLVLTGHPDRLSDVIWSPDGKRIAASYSDGTVRIWELDGSKRVSWKHKSSIQGVSFSPDGKRIAIGSWDHTARIWNIDGSGVPVVLDGHKDEIASVAFSPDGNKIATGSKDQTIYIWSADGSGSPLLLSGHSGPVTAVAYSPDSKRLASGSEDRTVRIWNADGSGSPLVLAAHSDIVSSVAYSPDGKKLASGSFDALARIWNADGSGVPIVLRGHGSYIFSVAFSLNGNKLVTSSLDGSVRIWNSDGSGVLIVLSDLASAVKNTSSAFSPDATKLLTYSLNKVLIMNADGTGTPLVLKGPKAPVTAAAFSPDGSKVVAGYLDGTAHIWTVASDVLHAALWDATTNCLPSESRQHLLLESIADAQQGYEHCRQEVGRRHGWSSLNR